MPKHCPACRPIIHNERKRDAMASARAEVGVNRDRLREILDPMREYMSDSMIMTAEQFLDDLVPDSDVPFVADRMPAGTSTPSGPNEGATTEFEDLYGELETRRLAAIMHDWHAEHPQWWQD